MKKALIILIAMAFVAAFSVPAAAQTEWGFYGSARVTTFSYDDDRETGKTYSPLFDDRDTVWGNQNNSRFGATAKAGNISGHVEIRETSEFRIVWGEWDFGFGKLGVGKHYTPANMFYSNQVGFGEANLLNSGGYYTGADHMIRLRFQGIADIMDFDMAFVDPNAVALATGFQGNPESIGWDTTVAPPVPFVIPAAGYQQTDIDTTWPQVEGRLLFNFGPVQMELGGAYVSFENVAVDANNLEREYSIDAWAVHFGTKLAMGPFYANGSIFVGENNAYLGQWTVDAAVATYDAATDSLIDSDLWGWQLIAGFKLNDMISFEAGYGENRLDTNIAGQWEDKVATYYFQTVLSPAKGVLIIPEIGKQDYKNTVAGADEGDTVYFGAVWKISF
ncbi:MAG: porin [Desulfatiglandales bacterium]